MSENDIPTTTQVHPATDDGLASKSKGSEKSQTVSQTSVDAVNLQRTLNTIDVSSNQTQFVRELNIREKKSIKIGTKSSDLSAFKSPFPSLSEKFKKNDALVKNSLQGSPLPAGGKKPSVDSPIRSPQDSHDGDAGGSSRDIPKPQARTEGVPSNQNSDIGQESGPQGNTLPQQPNSLPGQEKIQPKTETPIPEPGGAGGPPPTQNIAEQNTPPIQKKKASKDSELTESLEKGAGAATSEWWWAGFGISAAVFFSGFDFLLGAIIMDGYWVAHAKKPTLFPLKKWQKGVTVFANISPFIFAALFVVLVITVACTMPVYKYIITGAGIVTGNGSGICSNLDLSKTGSSSVTAGAPANVGNLNGVGAGVCQSLGSGPASVASLSQGCFGSNAPKASAIAAAESGGIATRESGSDKCADGNSVSIGLFQINLTNHQMGGFNCPAAFTRQYTGSDHSCIVKTDSSSQALYQNCMAAAKDPANNIQAACTISHNGASWNQWGANSKCGF